MAVTAEFDRHPYLIFTKRVPKMKALGTLIPIFERFSNWQDPKMQVTGDLTFEKIDKANTTMSVSEAFVFCEQFGLYNDRLITKPEVMLLFAMTASGSDAIKQNENLELQIDPNEEFMKSFLKYKARNSRDLTEQKFPLFLARIAIVMGSRPPIGGSHLTMQERVERFIQFFKFNDPKYVKSILRECKNNKNKKTSNVKFTFKGSGLTNTGANGLKKLKKYLDQILYDVDIASASQPLYKANFFFFLHLCV